MWLLDVLLSGEPAPPGRLFAWITDEVVPSHPEHLVPTSLHPNTGPHSPGLPPCFPTSLCQAGGPPKLCPPQLHLPKSYPL